MVFPATGKRNRKLNALPKPALSTRFIFSFITEETKTVKKNSQKEGRGAVYCSSVGFYPPPPSRSERIKGTLKRDFSSLVFLKQRCHSCLCILIQKSLQTLLLKLATVFNINNNPQSYINGAHKKGPALETSHSKNVPSLKVQLLKRPTAQNVPL